MVQINQSELDEINQTFKKLADVDKSKTMKEFVDYVYDKTIERVNKHTKTGAMLRAVFLHKQNDAYYIGVDKKIKYARAVHDGFEAFDIRPRKRKVIRFVGNDGNFVQFWGPKSKQQKYLIMKWKEEKGIKDRFIFKWPHHPGYKGDPFLTLALDDGLKKLPEFFNKLEKELK